MFRHGVPPLRIQVYGVLPKRQAGEPVHKDDTRFLGDEDLEAGSYGQHEERGAWTWCGRECDLQPRL